MLIKIISFGGHSEKLNEAMQVRHSVFVEEMGIDPEIDFDGKDIDAIHFLLYVDDKPTATARYLELKEGIKIERFAVIKEKRGQALGHLLLRYIVRDALPSKKTIFVNAPIALKGFFEYNGFVPEGVPFEDSGEEKIKMVYDSKRKKKSLITRMFKKK